MAADNSLGSGAHYRMEDYASFLRRIGVLLIDTFLLGWIGTAIWIGLSMLSMAVDPSFNPGPLFLITWLSIIWTYLVPLKRSSFRKVD